MQKYKLSQNKIKNISSINSLSNLKLLNYLNIDVMNLIILDKKIN